MLQQQNDDDKQSMMVGGANGKDGEKVVASDGDDDGQQSQLAQQSEAGSLKPIAVAGPPSSTAEDQQSSLGPTATTEGELSEELKKRKSRARKDPTKTEQHNQQSSAFTRRRLSISLPNCALSSNREREEVEEESAFNKTKEQKNPQQSRERQQKKRLTEKEQQNNIQTKSKGLGGTGAGPSATGGVGGGGCHHRAEQRMQAFLGTCKLKETVEFLRGTIGRSRRKGADLGGGKDAPRPCPVNNAGNGVCPVPETVTASSSNCAASGNKKTGVVSFSQAGSAKSARKAVQSVDSCVADSFDDQMINKICTLPSNMDRNEWLAAHVLALFEHVNGISCTLSEICTPVTCSVMSFPGNQKAPWLDERGKRHNYSAMRYIDSVMSCCEALRTNQSIFPTKYGVSFSADFEAHSARIVRLLWHCLGHIYTKHWEHLGSLNLRPQFGLVLTHLARLAKMYGLMTEKELNPVQNTIQLARPICQQQSTIQQQRASLKRGMAALEDGNGNGGGEQQKTTVVNPNTVQGRIQQAQQRKQQEKERQNGNNTCNLNNQQNQQTATAMITTMMKSGSWGGQSAMVLAAGNGTEAQTPPTTVGAGGILANCQPKCYAQTC